MTDDYDLARVSLARLQALIVDARILGSNGANLEVIWQKQVDDLVASLWLLDKYLTGKTEGRNHDADSKRFFDLYVNVRDFHVHLSDGGYSRLSLFLEDGHPVRMDLSLSREPVKKKWAALFPPS